jgi:hypothetical protein
MLHKRSHLLLILASVATTGFRTSSDDTQEDPIVAFSANDDLDQIVSSGNQLDHAELVIERCTMGIEAVDSEYVRRKAQMARLGLL